MGGEAKKQEKKTLVLADEFRKNSREKKDVAILNAFKASSYSKSLSSLASSLPRHRRHSLRGHARYGVVLVCAVHRRC